MDTVREAIKKVDLVGLIETILEAKEWEGGKKYRWVPTGILYDHIKSLGIPCTRERLRVALDYYARHGTLERFKLQSGANVCYSPKVWFDKEGKIEGDYIVKVVNEK